MWLLPSSLESAGVFFKWQMRLETIYIHHVLLDWSEERKRGSKTEKSLEQWVLDLIISWEAEHTQTEEPANPPSAGWYFCSDDVFLLKFTTRSGTWARPYSLYFIPSVLHGALLTQSANLGTASARHGWNNCHSSLFLHHIFHLCRRTHLEILFHLEDHFKIFKSAFVLLKVTRQVSLVCFLWFVPDSSIFIFHIYNLII